MGTEFIPSIAAVMTAAAPLGAVWLHFEKKIAQLTKKVNECEAERETSKDHLLVTGVVTSLLLTQMELIAPTDPVLKMARVKLQSMFPVESDLPREMKLLLSALERIKERDLP